jgi:hypothetical protein
MKVLILILTLILAGCADNRVRIKPKVTVDYSSVENRELRDIAIYKIWEARQ